MDDVEPTGRWRHRLWRGRLVLQIEERGLHVYSAGGNIDAEWATRWRDATVSDLTVTEKPPVKEITDGKEV